MVNEFVSPPLISYKRGKTIGSQILRSMIQKQDVHTNNIFGTRNTGMYQCLNCVRCNHVIRGETFVHPDTGEIFQIRGYNTCLSQFVVYVIVCPCGEREMIPSLKRGGDRELKLKQRQVRWINKLNTLHLHGLNKDYDLYLFL
ncbi:hypothetical protein XELAEV_18035743mg [Xenopus laevis]|uniref:Uncharacterized protein n=1 Tax=Xenopus laevis TaxID=8355 RepID=A0A974CIG2_XENLA|nr:hypothetical protein XELAEV_18035743mg [Xenopus laevis]